MTSWVVETVPRASDVEITADELMVRLTDGRKLAVPLAWFPRLLHASALQREHWELLGEGAGIHWPDIDEDISIAGLLRGTPATEASAASTPAGG